MRLVRYHLIDLHSSSIEASTIKSSQNVSSFSNSSISQQVKLGRVMFPRSSILLVAVWIGLSSSAIVDYCNQGLCGDSIFEHITCEATGTLLPSCPDDARATSLTHVNIKQILELHNELRNKIASGHQPGFLHANRMTTMVSKTSLHWNIKKYFFLISNGIRIWLTTLD